MCGNVCEGMWAFSIIHTECKLKNENGGGLGTRLSKAYDTVWWEGLWEKMGWYGVGR